MSDESETLMNQSNQDLEAWRRQELEKQKQELKEFIIEVIKDTTDVGTESVQAAINLLTWWITR